MKKNILILIFLLINFTFCHAQDPEYSRAKIWFDGKSEYNLGRLGIDITEGEYRKGLWFISDFSVQELSRIRNAGFRTEILISDVTSFYVNRNDLSLRNSPQGGNCGKPAPLYPVPAHFYLGSMGGFFTYSQLLNILDSMALLFPNLISVKQPIDSISSIEGRPLYYLKISDNPSVDESEPEVLYTALHHAREPESLSQLIFYMWYLLENYNSDSTVSALVKNTEMYFIPCVNPDGYVYNESTNPLGGGLWRKNRRDNLDGTFGVDLNRNYGFEWAYDDIGSSDQGNSETYRGASAFSEPETQAIRNFTNAHSFKFALNYHTYGNHNIVPYGYISDFLSPDSTQFEFYGHAITRYNNYHVGTANQTVNYIVNGNSDDWMYGEQISKSKIYAMTPEIGQSTDGFWPFIDRIIPLAQENMYANFTLARLAGHYGTISHNDQTYVSLLNNEFAFSFTQLGLDTSGSFTISISPLSSNIISTGPSRVYTDMNSLQTITDSISFTLISTIEPTDEIRFVLTVDNGLYIETDTITRMYGSPVIVFSDEGSGMSNWNSFPSTWGITDEDFVSPPTSITDSPYLLYFPNTDSPLILSDFIDLSGVIDARLTFFAKWNTEDSYDFVQVFASGDNGGTWTPLCGKYTVEGSPFEAPGQPVYDDSKTKWIEEEMSLNDFLDQSILLKFNITSDDFRQRDGFYFDDLKVLTIQKNTGIPRGKTTSVVLSKAFPNPGSVNVEINYSNTIGGSRFNIYNSFGQIIFDRLLEDSSGKIIIPVNNLADGLYSYLVTLPDGSHSSPLKFIVIK